MKTYYVSQSGQRVGPFSIEQLAQLYQNGTLNDDTTVIEHESSTRLRLLDLLAPPKPRPQQPSASVDLDALVAQLKEPTLTIDTSDDELFAMPSRAKNIYELATMPSQLVSRFVDRWRDDLQRLDKLRDLWELIGHASLLCTAALLILGGLMGALFGDSFKPLFIGWGGALALFLFQYIALNALKACQALIDQNSRSRSNTIIYDAFGLLYLFAGLVICITIYAKALERYSVKFGPSTLFLASIVLGGLFSMYLAISVAALNPHLINILDNDEMDTSEETISLLMWNIKIPLYVAPIFYGVLSVVGTISILLNVIHLNAVVVHGPLAAWAESAQRTLGYMWFDSSFKLGSDYSFFLIYFGALSPLFIYLFALLMHLNIDFIHAVVSMAKRRIDR